MKINPSHEERTKGSSKVSLDSESGRTAGAAGSRVNELRARAASILMCPILDLSSTYKAQRYMCGGVMLDRITSRRDALLWQLHGQIVHQGLYLVISIISVAIRFPQKTENNHDLETQWSGRKGSVLP